MKSIQIHDTAFMTSTYRSTDEALSKDPYSKYWNNEATDKWIAQYLKAISKEEPFVHCLRNRFFYEAIKQRMDQNEIEILINFGAGFSMYPFLFDADLEHIEIDQPTVIAHKKEKIKEWTAEGKLPQRKIHFIPTDFNENYESELRSKIASIKGNKRSFILLEGVLFFLNRDNTIRLFNLFEKIQGSGEFVGSVSFRKSAEETVVFKKLIQFFEKKVVMNQHFEYQTIEDDFYENVNGYNLIEHQDYISLASEYVERELEENEILNEHLYILRKL